MNTRTIVLLTTAFWAWGCSTQKGGTDSGAGSPAPGYRGPIIDMHIHAFTADSRSFGMTHPPTLRGKTYKGVNTPAEQKEKTLEKFRQYHIVKAVVAGGHLWGEVGDGSILIGGANTTVAALRKQFGEGKLHAIAEVAPFYAGVLAGDSSVMPYFELAQALNIPMGFHILPGGPNYGLHLLPEMLGGMRVRNASPLQLEDALVKFPKLRLYVMHGGWPYIEDMKALMYAHPNVYVDIAVINWILPEAEFHNYLKALVDAGFGNRIMYGTDQMVWPDTIDDAVASVNAAPFLTMAQKEDIFYNNAARFLGLSPEEIAKHKSGMKR